MLAVGSNLMHEQTALKAGTSGSFLSQELQPQSAAEEILTDPMQSNIAAEQSISQVLNCMFFSTYSDVRPCNPIRTTFDEEKPQSVLRPIADDEMDVMTFLKDLVDIHHSACAECRPRDHRQLTISDEENLYDPVRRLKPTYPIPPPRTFNRTYSRLALRK